MSNSFNTLELQADGPVARIWLNRPELRNAFDDEVIGELSAAFAQVVARPEVRVIVLGARGPAFCAGANLNWMRRAADFTREQNTQDAAGLAAMLRTIHESPKPVIARIQGDVYAGGMGLVAACDMAVSVDSANYCLSEVKIGLIPATISPYVLRAMGTRAAQRYFLTAERFRRADQGWTFVPTETTPSPGRSRRWASKFLSRRSTLAKLVAKNRPMLGRHP